MTDLVVKETVAMKDELVKSEVLENVKDESEALLVNDKANNVCGDPCIPDSDANALTESKCVVDLPEDKIEKKLNSLEHSHVINLPRNDDALAEDDNLPGNDDALVEDDMDLSGDAMDLSGDENERKAATCEVSYDVILPQDNAELPGMSINLLQDNIEKAVTTRETSFKPMTLKEIRNSTWAKIPTRTPQGVSPGMKAAYENVKDAYEARKVSQDVLNLATTSSENAKAALENSQRSLNFAKLALEESECHFHQVSDALETAQLQEPSTWNTLYHKLQEFKSERGNLFFHAQDRKDPHIQKLQGWLSRQKDMYRKYQSGKMTTTKSYRITALEKLGIFVSKWDIRFNQLRKYKEMWGHCNVPTRNHSELKQLGIWVGFQRGEFRNFRERKKSTITEERIKKLDSLGFVWSPCQANGWKPSTRVYTKKGDELQTKEEIQTESNVIENELQIEDQIKNERSIIENFSNEKPGMKQESTVQTNGSTVLCEGFSIAL